MDARFERYIEDLRTVRTLSQPKFSPDMKAKELLETIQSNAIKCFDYMKENNAILNELVFQRVPAELTSAEIASLQEFADKMFDYDSSEDCGIAYKVYSLLLENARLRGDKPAIVRYLYEKAVSLHYLNVRGIDRGTGLPITAAMVRRCLAAAVWGDTLALLRNQTRPYEAVPGTAEALWRRWTEDLGQDLAGNRGLTRREILRRCREMAAEFRAVERVPREVQKVAIVGEIYTKYCHLGNWNLERYLAAEHCEIGVGGITWYALYYMDGHALKGSAPARRVYRLLASYLAEIQRDMLSILNQAGYHALPPLPELKRQAEGYAPLRVTVADGWLIAAEAVGWARLGYRKILCVQPFACLPGHIFGKGQYAALQRKLPGARLVSVDYDASTGEGTVLSRIRMLLDEELDPELL